MLIKSVYNKIVKNNDDIEITLGKIKEVEETTIDQSFENTESILKLNVDIYNKKIEQAEKMKEELLNIEKHLGISTAVEENQ